MLYSRFPLAIYFTHGSGFMSNLIFQFVPPSPSPPGSTCQFSTSTSMFLDWKKSLHFKRGICIYQAFDKLLNLRMLHLAPDPISRFRKLDFLPLARCISAACCREAPQRVVRLEQDDGCDQPNKWYRSLSLHSH